MYCRNFYRINYVTTAKVIIADVCFEATTENLSANGLFLRTDHPLPTRAIVKINFNIPSASYSSITVNGEVVRKSPHGLAFQFKSIDYGTFSELKAVIKRKPIPCW